MAGQERQRRGAAQRERREAVGKRRAEIGPFEIDDLTGIGPYSVYPRTSAIEPPAAEEPLPLEEPGGELRDDALSIDENQLINTHARWDGMGYTYWWAFSKGGPGYVQQQRIVWELTVEERQQLSKLMRNYITDAIVNEHANALKMCACLSLSLQATHPNSISLRTGDPCLCHCRCGTRLPRFHPS